MRRRWALLGLVAWSVHAPPALAKPLQPRSAAPLPAVRHAGAKPRAVVGRASWYGHYRRAHRTANGEVFDHNAYTAAHRTLPFGTLVRVTNLRNGRSTIVRINDRGPFVEDRLIDLTYGAAREIGMLGHGVARVRLEVVPPEALEVARREMLWQGDGSP